MIHISKLTVERKTAGNLAKVSLYADAYHANIKRAALLLCQQGMPGFVYSTQWATGSTEWYNGFEEKKLIVTTQGVIRLSTGFEYQRQAMQPIFRVEERYDSAENFSASMKSLEQFKDELPAFFGLVETWDFTDAHISYNSYEIVIKRLTPTEQPEPTPQDSIVLCCEDCGAVEGEGVELVSAGNKTVCEPCYHNHYTV